MPESTTTEASIDPAEVSRLRLAVARLHRLIRLHGVHGLSLTDGSCLAVVDRHGPLPLSEIASRENLSAPAVTKVVARLESQGLVERLADPTDRRVSLIVVSTAGHELMSKSRRERTAYLHERLGELDTHDRQLILAALPVLETLANEYERPGSG